MSGYIEDRVAVLEGQIRALQTLITSILESKRSEVDSRLQEVDIMKKETLRELSKRRPMRKAARKR